MSWYCPNDREHADFYAVGAVVDLSREGNVKSWKTDYDIFCKACDEAAAWCETEEEILVIIISCSRSSTGKEANDL